MCTFSQSFQPPWHSEEELLSCQRQHDLDDHGLCTIHSLQPDKSLTTFSAEVKDTLRQATSDNNQETAGKQGKTSKAKQPI